MGTWECDSPDLGVFSLWCWCDARGVRCPRVCALVEPSVPSLVSGRLVDNEISISSGNSKTTPKLAKRGAEVDPVSGRSRIHAHPRPRNVHRASSCVTASTHAFEWIVGSPHASQSAPAHHSSGFSKESVIPGDDGHENRASGRPQRRTRAVVRARRGRDHHGSPRATRTILPDARSGLMSLIAPTAPIPPCPEQCSHSIFRLVKKVGYDFWLVPRARRVFRPPEVRRTLRYVRLRPAIQQIRFFLALKSPRRRANMPWNMPRSAVW